MTAILDMIGASILFGVLILTVARVQSNLNSTMYQNTYNTITQTAAVNLALQIERDLIKAGYGVSGNNVRMYLADTSSFGFRGALTFGGSVDSVSYALGGQDTTTMNPRDRIFIRSAASTGGLRQRIGLTMFSVSYYDTSNNKMNTPVTGAAAFRAIRSIQVKFRLESFEPIETADTSAYYFAVNWEKLIYPRNLGRLR